MKIENGKTYIGVVEDNNDPKKLGRIKVRVLNVFDNTPLENIPWANPWKDIAGNSFSLPDVGKVVTVVFENANKDNPEFIFSDHYNANLEKKLLELNESDYKSMKSFIFDHKTQFYVNDSEGLILDHKFNKINIKEKSINLNLKDNFAKVNIGSENSTQRIILGDNFLEWFDNFVQVLTNGAFLGNLGAPVIATPALLGSLQAYQSLKDSKFLSKNIYAVDNEKVSKLDRVAEGQIGDTWQSTVVENTITSKEEVNFKPVDSENSDLDIIRQLMKDKNYTLYEDVYKMNIIAVRTQCQKEGDKYTDLFVDKLFLMFKKEDGNWELKQYLISTVPGLKFTITEEWLTEKNLKDSSPWKEMIGKKIYMKEYINLLSTTGNVKSGLKILVPSQYIDLYYLSQYKGEKAFLTTTNSKQLVWRDNDATNVDLFKPNNLLTPESISSDMLNFHLGYPDGINVGNWSEGSQVFSDSKSLNEFFSYCEKHIEKHGNAFTYTLVTKNDWDDAENSIDVDKKSI